MKWLLVVVALSVVIVGCATEAKPELPAATATAAKASPTLTPNRPAASPTPAANRPASPCNGGSLEGCFTYATMGSYLKTIEPMVAEFFETRFPAAPAPRDIVFVARGRAVADSCGGYATAQSYEYCPANRTIYIGQDLLWSFYKGAGDAGPAIGLAHEWGHHLQTMMRVPAGRTAAQSVKFENQADCISGAWAKYAQEKGWLEVPDDINDVGTMLQAIGSREGPYRDHGTARERQAAFDMSFKGGIEACDSFFPNAPVS